MKAAVIAGTSEATELIDLISGFCDVTAFTATSYGTEILKKSRCTVREGRLDENGFTSALEGFDAVADMSHPFAEEVTGIVRRVCLKLGIPYLRGGREKLRYDYDRIIYVSSKEEAADILEKKPGNIFLTTGVKTLSYYEDRLSECTERIFSRVLDSRESRALAAGSRTNVIYAVPPFTEEDTCRVIEENRIMTLVTKDSGLRGGLPEKINAAKKYGTEVIVICSPESEITPKSPDEIYRILKSMKGHISVSTVHER